MRRSVRDETHQRGRSSAPKRAPDRPEGPAARPLARQSTGPSNLLALQSSAGNAAVTAVVQRMEAAGGKRGRSGSPEEQQPSKRAPRAAESSSSEEERLEPFSTDAVRVIDAQQTKTMELLERMDAEDAPESVKQVAQDKLEILSLLRNLVPMRSAETVREAIRLVSQRPRSKTRTTYLEELEEQLDYLNEEFPSAGPPTRETLKSMWDELSSAFGSAGGRVGEDGCEDRAHAICLAIARHAPTIAAHHLSKQWATSSGSRMHADHQWNHHVAASVTTADGVLVIDPVFSRKDPIELSSWISQVQVDRRNVHQTAWGFLGRPGPDNRPDANSATQYTG